MQMVNKLRGFIPPRLINYSFRAQVSAPCPSEKYRNCKANWQREKKQLIFWRRDEPRSKKNPLFAGEFCDKIMKIMISGQALNSETERCCFGGKLAGQTINPSSGMRQNWYVTILMERHTGIVTIEYRYCSPIQEIYYSDRTISYFSSNLPLKLEITTRSMHF